MISIVFWGQKRWLWDNFTSMSMFDFITVGLDAQIVVQASVANLRCTLEVPNKADILSLPAIALCL